MPHLAVFGHTVLRPLVGDTRARWLIGQVWAVCTMVWYSLRAQYARAALGILWALLTPLLFLAVYVPLFTYVFNIQSPGNDALAFPLYVVCGFIGWAAFQEGLTQGTTALLYNPSIVKHSPAPPALLPLVKVASSFVGLLAGSLLLVAFLVAVARFPGVRLVLWPVAVGLFFLLTWGLALFMAALAIYVRDLTQVLTTLLSVEFFACPLIWRVDMVPEHLRPWVLVNPLTPFLNLLRASLLPGAPFAWIDLGLACAWAVGALLLGHLVFARLEPGFADAA